MTATTIPTEVSTFARAVRAALDDLPPDDIDDLTDGLEADLAESAAESSTDAGQLSDPSAYASELRAAAGFAPRRRRGFHPEVRGITEWYALKTRTLIERVNSTPTGERVWAFLVAIRPVWWLLRGWAIYEVAIQLARPGRPFEWIPANLILGLALSMAIIISVQWGRGQWLGNRWTRVAKVGASALAILALPFLTVALHPSPGVQYIDNTSAPVPGLAVDGQPINNIFAYDANGAALTRVQLFDQDGHRLDIASGEHVGNSFHEFLSADGVMHYLVQSGEVPGRNGWNVYPLREIAESDIDFSATPTFIDQAKTVSAAPPFLRTQPLAEETDATPTPSPAPTDSGAPVPSASPTDTGTPSPSPSP